MDSIESPSLRPSPIRPRFQDAVRQGDAPYRLATPMAGPTTGQAVRDLEPDWLAWEDTEIDIRRKIL